jgi:cytoskeletal protein RodZ
VTGYGPPDDPSEAPTGQYNYGEYGQQQPEPGSTPWHRKPAALIGLGVLAAILIALVIYGIVELTHGGGSTSPSPSSTTPPAVTTTPSSPSSATSTEPVAPAPTTSAETTTAPATTPPTSTSIDDGRHHHHHYGYRGMP